MKRKSLKDIMDSVMQVIKAKKNAIVSKAELSAEKKKQEKELLKKQADAVLKEFVRYDLMPNYKGVANAVYKCLIENHSQCGLCRPNDIEGVIYSDLDKAIDMDPAISKISGVIFRAIPHKVCAKIG